MFLETYVQTKGVNGGFRVIKKGLPCANALP
jgi:hypothetical protein